MSLLQRTLIASPAALVAVALFAATSQPQEFRIWASDSVDGTVLTDADGLDDGLVTVVLVGEGLEDADLQITVSGDTRRSLRVSAPDEGREPARVNDDYTLTRGLPGACEEFDPASDTDVPGACTVKVPLLFEGGREKLDEVRITAALGTYDLVDPPAGSVFTLDLDYDADPPVQD